MPIQIHRYVTDTGYAVVLERADGIFTFNPLCWRDGEPVLRPVMKIEEHRYRQLQPGRLPLEIHMRPMEGTPGVLFFANRVTDHNMLVAESVRFTWLTIDYFLHEVHLAVFGTGADGRIWHSGRIGEQVTYRTFSHSSDSWSGELSAGVHAGDEIAVAVEHQRVP